MIRHLVYFIADGPMDGPWLQKNIRAMLCRY